MTKICVVFEQRKAISRIRVFIQRGTNFSLPEIDRNVSASGLDIDITSKVCFMQLNSLFSNSGVRDILKGNDYRAEDIIFPVIE